MEINVVKSEDEELIEHINFNPHKTDFLYNLIIKISRGNPLYTGLLYFLISFVGVYILGILTGQIFGNDFMLPMYSNILDNINIGFLAPVGAGLLCHLYNTLNSTVQYVKQELIIPQNEMKQLYNLLLKFEKKLNNKYIVFGSLLLSIFINMYNYFGKTDSWLGINGGITGLYGRIFIVFNFFIIILIIYKSIITIWGLQKILQLNIKIQPMHPDRAAGLKPLGKLSLAVNYFVALILIYFSLLIIFDPYARQQPIYICFFLVFYISAPILLFLSLSKANHKMLLEKQEALHRLKNTFQYYYDKLTADPKSKIYDIESADEINIIYGLYEIVEKMPVWPFDIKNVLRLFSSITIPLVALLIDMLANTDSILYNLDKIQLLVK